MQPWRCGSASTPGSDVHIDCDVNGAVWRCAVGSLNSGTWPTSSYLLQRVVMKIKR